MGQHRILTIMLLSCIYPTAAVVLVQRRLFPGRHESEGSFGLWQVSH